MPINLMPIHNIFSIEAKRMTITRESVPKKAIGHLFSKVPLLRIEAISGSKTKH